jgi:rhamnopyranosyl-N-acetylglucosaminyl-diphospho-decaprenol beta-1,3/1,4-galactofuranosyltransferase
MGNYQSSARVIAVVVTYNRLDLLKECITSIQNQSYKVDQVIVIDNDSDDGTAQWLASKKELIVVHQENMGGSGGFFTGIKLAESYNPDWIWVMDDDTICEPDSLYKLIEKITPELPQVGFIGSKSIWKDGSPHLMNVPAIGPVFNKCFPFNLLDKDFLLLTETSSFVSLLINTTAIRQVGLPYKEFFIWGDDQEFTKRITAAGYLGLYCMNSYVLHKTAVNYFTDFCRDTPQNLWKHGYGFRNEFFLIKRDKGIPYFLFWLPIKLIKESYKVLKFSKQSRFKFIRTLCHSAWKSIFFNPKIQRIT